MWKNSEFPEVFTACAVTQAMSRAAQSQAGTDPRLETKDTLEGLADTFLCDDTEGGPLSAIDPVVEDPYIDQLVR